MSVDSTYSINTLIFANSSFPFFQVGRSVSFVCSKMFSMKTLIQKYTHSTAPRKSLSIAASISAATSHQLAGKVTQRENTLSKRNINLRDITRNIEENERPHEIFR